MKEEIKKEIRVKILNQNFSPSELISFRFSELKKANWIDDEEFSLNGKMYDVVKTEYINHQKIVSCIKDKKETLILPIKNLAEFFLKKKDKNHFLEKENKCQNYQVKTIYPSGFCHQSMKLNPKNNSEFIFYQNFEKSKFFPSFFNPPKMFC